MPLRLPSAASSDGPRHTLKCIYRLQNSSSGLSGAGPVHHALAAFLSIGWEGKHSRREPQGSKNCQRSGSLGSSRAAWVGVRIELRVRVSVSVSAVFKLRVRGRVRVGIRVRVTIRRRAETHSTLIPRCQSCQRTRRTRPDSTDRHSARQSHAGLCSAHPCVMLMCSCAQPSVDLAQTTSRMLTTGASLVAGNATVALSKQALGSFSNGHCMRSSGCHT